ncbi:MAG TPA: methyltransferase domain-containing protein [Symbiobacteriaceae bacterium]|jgi:ubiquinone/menaquinone biosynthesis C-methylase UbiE
MANTLKLLVLALDGATPRFIHQHRLDLPHLHALMQAGTSGVVTGPPFSYDRWFTYYTGLTPDQHGMEFLRHSSAGRIGLTMSNARDFLWDYVTRAGLRFGMLGGLGCEPPAKVDGFWVNFYYDAFHPAEAEQLCTNLWLPIFPFALCAEMGTKPWDEVSPQTVVDTLAQYDWKNVTDWVAQRQHRERDMLDALMTRWPVDVLWYYAFELDWSQHLAAHRPDTLVTCYQLIDETLGYLQAKYRPEITLVISDHGLSLLGPDNPNPIVKPLPGIGGCVPLDNWNTVWTGEHHPDAFYGLSGPGVPAGARSDIDFIQVFPLLLDRLGIAIPAGLPGKPPSLRAPMAGGQPSHGDLWKVRALRYNQLQWVWREDLLAFMIGHCGATEQAHVLDLGTGTGAVACALAAHVSRVLGVDLEPAMLEQARSACPNGKFRVMDVQALDLPDNSVDLVTARMVLHHVADLSRALAEARRVLTRGGRIVLCEGVPPSPLVLERYREIFALKEPGRHIFTEDTLFQLLDEAGFVNIGLHSHVVPQVSLKNWLAASGLPTETCAQIVDLHRTADAAFWAAYQMKELGEDLLMDWKFVVATGTRAMTDA